MTTNDAILEAINSLRKEMQDGQTRLEAGQTRLEAGQTRLEAGQDDLWKEAKEARSDIKRLDNNVGELKGFQIMTLTLQKMQSHGSILGFKVAQYLTSNELGKLVQSSDTTGIEERDLDSFKRADIIIKAFEASGTPCYIAIEASYTVDKSDTRRAIRNAEFLTRFTKEPAYAIVSGVKKTKSVDQLIHAGMVEWYQIPKSKVKPR